MQFVNKVSSHRSYVTGNPNLYKKPCRTVGLKSFPVRPQAATTVKNPYGKPHADSLLSHLLPLKAEDS